MMTWSRASSGVVAVIDKVVDLWHSISYSAYLVTEGRRRNVRRSGGSKVGRHFPRLCHPSGTTYRPHTHRSWPGQGCATGLGCLIPLPQPCPGHDLWMCGR